MNPYLIYGIVSVTIGIICAILAKKTGRDPWLWLGVGTFFSGVGLIILVLIKKKK